MSPLEHLVGPFYNAEGACDVLGVSQDELDALADAGRVLALSTGDGTVVYPSVQFGDDYTLTPHLAEALAALGKGSTERWTWALWVTAPNESWDEMSAIEWLRAGKDPAPVLYEAAADASRWRR